MAWMSWTIRGIRSGAPWCATSPSKGDRKDSVARHGTQRCRCTCHRTRGAQCASGSNAARSANASKRSSSNWRTTKRIWCGGWPFRGDAIGIPEGRHGRSPRAIGCHGVGTGDTKIAFAAAVRATCDTALSTEWRYRAHNEYLTLLDQLRCLRPAVERCSAGGGRRGCSGRGAIRYFIAWAIIFGISCLTDDTIETQAGATFFGLYYALFVFAAPRESPQRSGSDQVQTRVAGRYARCTYRLSLRHNPHTLGSFTKRMCITHRVAPNVPGGWVVVLRTVR